LLDSTKLSNHKLLLICSKLLIERLINPTDWIIILDSIVRANQITMSQVETYCPVKCAALKS